MSGRIESMYNSLSKSDKIIADFFMKNEKDIISMNIYDLAQHIGTSSASISRFVKKVFGKNFSQAKIEMAKTIEQNEIKSASEILGWAVDYIDMPNKIIFNIEKVCQDVITYNGIKPFEESIQLMSKAENIYLFGVGSSGLVAQDLCQKLIKLKKRAFYVTDSNFGVLSSLLCTKNDVVVAISDSGNTKEVNLAVKKARELGAKIIVLTSNVASILYKNADIKIALPSIESSTFRLAAIFSRYGQLFVIDMLFIGLAKTISDNPNQLLEGYIELLKDLKISNVRKIKK